MTGLEGIGSEIGTGATNLYNALPSPATLFSGTPASAPPAIPAPVAAPTVDPITALNQGPSTPVNAPAVPVVAPPAASAPTNWGGILKAIATSVEAYQRYQQQQDLQDPNWVANQIRKLQQPLSANLKNAVGNQVQAQAQEAGLSGAPGLFQTALAQALAPYQFQEQQNAEQAFFNAEGASDRAYPLGGLDVAGLFPQATA